MDSNINHSMELIRLNADVYFVDCRLVVFRRGDEMPAFYKVVLDLDVKLIIGNAQRFKFLLYSGENQLIAEQLQLKVLELVKN